MTKSRFLVLIIMFEAIDIYAVEIVWAHFGDRCQSWVDQSFELETIWAQKADSTDISNN